MIRCVNIHKRYRQGKLRVQALEGAELRIDEPGFYAVMGPSGSGKSTLLHLMAGLDWPDEGEIHIAGSRIDTLDDRRLTRHRRERTGVVFQQFNLIPTMSAVENVELPGLLAGHAPARRRSRAEELLESLGLTRRAHHRPDALSGGEQQRVAIARALYFSPPVLFADEPTGALDSASSQALWRLLGQLAQREQLTVLMVTHEPQAAMHCRSVHVLRDGRVVDQFSTEGLDARSVADRYRLAGG